MAKVLSLRRRERTQDTSHPGGFLPRDSHDEISGYMRMSKLQCLWLQASAYRRRTFVAGGDGTRYPPHPHLSLVNSKLAAVDLVPSWALSRQTRTRVALRRATRHTHSNGLDCHVAERPESIPLSI